jgi:hypothetical protein
MMSHVFGAWAVGPQHRNRRGRVDSARDRYLGIRRHERCDLAGVCLRPLLFVVIQPVALVAMLSEAPEG